MINDQDHYEAFYGDKLWNLLPAIYRALDTDQFNANGPLRELVNRIGAQAATIRRSLDRMWEDQSIETCDDWVIPYIGDLLATNLVTNLDTRAQRLDVARTIYYRRRKGTLAILEEIAHDITGWNVKLVEFFRRLGRTRHLIDPPIGLASVAEPEVAELQLAEGLVGPLTRTGLGGFADLRSVFGASKARSAFDEFSHTADFRLGQGQVGWYGIPRLGVFLWRLQSFSVPQTTPVESSLCPGQFTFDPTGRAIPLFAVPSRNYGDLWTSPAEWQLPTPISSSLLEPALANPPAYTLYAEDDPNDGSVIPKALGVYRNSHDVFTLIQADEFTTDPAIFYAPASSGPPPSTPRPDFLINPEHGRLIARKKQHLSVTYTYGFSSEIGAGPYDRRQTGSGNFSLITPPTCQGGGSIGLVPSSGTLTILDSLTYTASHHFVDVQGSLAFRADNEQRPVIRFAPTPSGWTEWRFDGQAVASDGSGNCLVLDGLLISGADVILEGVFDCVTLISCTLDPGSAATPPTASQDASMPASVFAQAEDGRDLVPCRLWIEGQVGILTIQRCITGPIRTRGKGEVATLNITDSIVQAIPTFEADVGSIPDSASIPYSASIPDELPDLALKLSDGDVVLSRCTVLGPIAVHRLQASECILWDVAVVDDTQHGCVRFSTFAKGSTLPRQFESVQIAPESALFTSTDFGNPGYGQLLPTVDLAILPASGPASPKVPTIASGAQNGSEMGAFSLELNSIKERGLLIKYQEYMPAGLVPVPIYIT